MRALITGASSGIGYDLARVLSSKYDEIIIVGRNKEKLEELKNSLNCFVKLVSTDISKEDNCIKLYNENKNIDLLINCAGFGDCGEFSLTDLNKDLNMINTNIVGLHILTKLYLKD